MQVLAATRRTAVLIAVAVSLVAAVLSMPPANAEPWNWRDPDTADPNPPARDAIGVNPIATNNLISYTDTFGACRGSGCSRPHLGVDMMAHGRKGDPVVAYDDGVVSWIAGSCCSVHITHDDGWSTRYIHMNNDTQRADGSYTDDGQGWGIAPGIERGTRVTAGQLIGWVGDSGNAESVGPHLHFEIVDPTGTWHNPTPYVDRAVRLSAPLPGVWEGQFWDDEGSVHEANIDIMYDQGITRGCNPPENDKFCPTRQITRGEIAAFLRRLLALDAVGTDYFADDAESIFQDDINALAEEGIAFGCTETDYCPDAPLRRDEMAELLVRTFGYDNPGGTDFFVDDGSSVFQESINKLANHDITKGCNPPDNTNFCPDRTLDRAEMATFLARALELGT